MEPIELRCRREALGLLQRELAVRLGVAQNTLSQWESGARQVPDYVDGELAAIERDLNALVDQFIRDIDRQEAEDPDLDADYVLFVADDAPALVRIAAGRVAARLWDRLGVSITAEGA